MPADSNAPECFIDDRGRLLESPLWDGVNHKLYWCDIPTGEVHCLEVGNGRRQRWTFDGPIGSMGLARSGRLLLSIADTVHFFDTKREILTPLARIISDWPSQRLNDGKVGPDGAFWVGSMDNREPKEPIAALFRVTADGSVERKIDDLVISNGLAWSADGRTMFHSDSRGPWIDRWDFDRATGEIGNRHRIRTLANEDGRPDGGATDMAGNYWSAGVSAGCLNRFDRDGQLLLRIELPVAAPTMPCFAGDDMKTLFITSLRDNISAERLSAYPHSGGIVRMRVDTAGAPVPAFMD